MNNLQSVERAKFEQQLEDINREIDVLQLKLEKVSFLYPVEGSGGSTPALEMETTLSHGLRTISERLQNIINNLSL